MSLRLRLLLGLGLVALVVVGVAGLVMRSTRDDLLDTVDEQLRTAAGGPSFADGGRQDDDDGSPYPGGVPGGGGVPPWMAQGGQATFAPPSTLWVGVVADGELVVRTQLTDADGDEISPRLSGAFLADVRVGDLSTVPGDGARRFRVLARQGPGDGIFLVAAPLDDVDASIRQLVVVEVIATGVVLVLLGLVALWVLRLGVRPIQQMTHTATAIADGDLSQRVPEADPRTEAGELGIALNTMLTRIEEAFAASAASEDRLRRFVADASHELRTPITTIRGYAELSRRGGLEEPEARAAAMARTEQEAIRMGALVEDLLLLARLDQGRPLESDPVDLAVLADDARGDAAATHADHPVTVTAEPGCIVVGDDHRLRQVVANLVGNAVRHTPAGTTVALTVAVAADDPSHVALTVADDGPGMAPELAARAFERFARGDVARSRAAGSTGLGLSIVQAIVTAHGGTVALESGEGEGTTVRVTLPRAGPAAADGSAGPDGTAVRP